MMIPTDAYKPSSHRKSSNLPLIFSFLSLIFLLVGAGSIVLLQAPLRETRQSQSRASVGNGQVAITSAFQNPTAPNQNATLTLSANTQGVQVNGIQLVFHVITSASDFLNVQVIPNSGLQAISQEVQKTSDGFLVSVIAVPSTIGQPFSSTTPHPFLTLLLQPTTTGQVQLTFDQGNSLSTIYASNPPQDTLQTLPTIINTLIPFAAASPSPSPSPSASPSPAATCQPRPACLDSNPPCKIANPVDPNYCAGVIDDIYFDGSNTSLQFYKNDGSNQLVSADQLQTGVSYKVVATFQVQNTYKSSNADSKQIAVTYSRNGNITLSKSYNYSFLTNHRDGFGDSFTDYFTPSLTSNTFALQVDYNNVIQETNENNNIWTFTTNYAGTNSGTTNQQCNASCTSNANCANNLTCYYNQCRLATNVTDTSCNTPPDKGLQRQCNQYCANTGECAAGFTCFYNQCRRPDNPDNASCGIPSATVTQSMAQSCNTTCSSNRDCAVNMRCYGNQCRLASNPGSLSCSAATSATVSYLYSSNGQTKGQEIPLPAGSATLSARVSPSPSTFDLFPNGTGSSSANSNVSASGSITANTTVLSDVISFLQNMIGAQNFSLPIIATGIGLFLLLLAILFFIASRSENKDKKIKIAKIPTSSTPNSFNRPSPATAVKTPMNNQGSQPPKSSVITPPASSIASTVSTGTTVGPEKTLEEKIRLLQQQKQGAVVSTAKLIPAPTPTPITRPVNINTPPPAKPLSTLPPKPATNTAPTTQPVQASALRPSAPTSAPAAPIDSTSSMVDRLKAKGITTPQASSHKLENPNLPNLTGNAGNSNQNSNQNPNQ